ncbi:MAG TPA: lipopolysaccharide biosynthesis protein [Caulobacteraceae bacterium]|jgi:O-antigen/teichoic acid export membrane protein|nr:lipopolysaccharide biosynthesis protein [Caulobacteraceae bacterium]
MFLRGVLAYLPVNLVQAVAGFGSIVVFTRLLSPGSYGDYALAFSVSALAHTLTLTWIEAGMARFYAAEDEGPGRDALFATLYRTFAVVGLACPLAGMLVLAFAPLGHELKLAIVAGLVSAVARGLLRMAQERRRAAGDVKGFAAIDMLATGGGFAIGCALALAGFGAAGPFAGVGLAAALCLVLALPSEWPHIRRGRFEPERLKGYLAYGLPLSLSLMLGLALASTDRFVLAAYVGDAAVGAYHAGYTLSNRTLDVVFAWIGMAGGPAAVAALERGGEAALRRTALSQASTLLVVGVPAALGVALVAHPLAEVMVGAALADQASRVTPWIAAGALFSGLTTYYLHTAFTLARRTRRQMLAVAIPAAANLILCLVLIPRYGLDGAMWSTAGSYGLGMVAAWLLGRGCMPLPIPWGGMVRIGVATAAMALAVTHLPALGGVAELLLKAGVGAVVYAAMVAVLDAGGMRSQGLGMLHERMNRPPQPVEAA